MLRKHKSLTLLMLVMFVTSLFPASVMAGESAAVSPQVLNAATDPPSEIEIQYSGDTTLKVKDKVQLAVVGYDENGNVVKLKKVKWTTSNPSVLAVDAKGKVTAKKAGESTISVTTTGIDGDDLTASLDFQVKDPNQVSRLEIQYDGETDLNVGDTATLKAVAYNEDDAIIKSAKIKWSSDNADAVSVDSKGKIKAKNYGQATITALVQVAGFDDVTAELTFSVRDPNQVVELQIDYDPELGDPPALKIGESTQLNAIGYDADGNEVTEIKNLKWASSDAAVAKVDKSGKVTAKKAGNVTIRVSVSDDVAAELELVVRDPNSIDRVEILYDGDRVLNIGDQIGLTAMGYSADDEEITPKTVLWSSSDTKVATVDKKGQVKAKSAGMVTITAAVKTSNGTMTGEIELEVKDPNTSNEIVALEIHYDGDTALKVGQQADLVAVAYDEYYNEVPVNVVNWRSSDPSVASVDRNGHVVAKKVGTVSILAAVTGSDGEVTAQLNFEVFDPERIDSVFIQYNGGETLKVGEVQPITVIAHNINGQEVPIKNVRWKVEGDAGSVSINPNNAPNANIKGVRVSASPVKIYAVVSGSTAEIRTQNDVTLSVVDNGNNQIAKLDASYNGPMPLAVNQRGFARVIAYNNLGQQVPADNIQWKSSNDAVVSVDNRGEVIGKSSGVAKIWAFIPATGTTPELRSNEIEIKVADNQQIAKLEIKSFGIVPPDKAKVGDRIPVEAIAYDQTGNRVQLNQVTWMSDNLNAVNFDATTLNMPKTQAICANAGSAVVTAQLMSTSGTQLISNPIQFNVTAGQQSKVTRLEVRVKGNPSIPVNGQAPVEAIGYDATGQQVRVDSVQWKSTPDGIVDFNPFNAPMSNVRGLAVGQTNIYAELPAQSDGTGYVRSNDVMITVTNGQSQITRLEVRVNGNPSIPVNGQVPVQAIGYDATGQQVRVDSVQWKASPGGIVDFNPLNAPMSNVRGLAAGQANIYAELPAQADGTGYVRSNDVMITVGGGQQQVAKIEIKANGSNWSPVNAKVGDRVPLEAIGYDSSGNRVPLNQVTWMSDNVNTVNFDAATLSMPNTQAICVNAGNAAITAQVPGTSGMPVVSNTITFYVTGGNTQVYSINLVAEGPTALKVGDFSRVKATLYDMNHNVITIPVTNLMFSSTNPAALVVDQTGQVKALAPGMGIQVTASIPATGTMPAVVSNAIYFDIQGTTAQISRVEIRANNMIASQIDLPVGGSAKFEALLYDANNNVTSGTAVNWMNTNPAAVMVQNPVSPATDVRGNSAGTATITAQFIPPGGTAITSNAIVVNVTGTQPQNNRLEIVADTTYLALGSAGTTVRAFLVDASGTPRAADVEWVVTSGSAILLNPTRGNSTNVQPIAVGTAEIKGHLPPLADGTGEYWSNPITFTIR